MGNFEQTFQEFVAMVLRGEADLEVVKLFLPDALGEYRRERKGREDAEKQATKDDFTNLYRKTSLTERLDALLKAAARHDYPTSVIMTDLDKFKRYNDTYGHLQGDRALKAVANTLQSLVRDSDVLARYGGEEFALVLPETELQKALEVAERIRSKVKAITIPQFKQFSDEGYKHITISCGVYTHDPTLTEVLRSAHEFTQHSLPSLERSEFDLTTAVLSAADLALYHAKRTRDAVVQYQPGMEMPAKSETVNTGK